MANPVLRQNVHCCSVDSFNCIVYRYKQVAPMGAWAMCQWTEITCRPICTLLRVPNLGCNNSLNVFDVNLHSIVPGMFYELEHVKTTQKQTDQANFERFWAWFTFLLQQIWNCNNLCSRCLHFNRLPSSKRTFRGVLSANLQKIFTDLCNF